MFKEHQHTHHKKFVRDMLAEIGTDAENWQPKDVTKFLKDKMAGRNINAHGDLAGLLAKIYVKLDIEQGRYELAQSKQANSAAPVKPVASSSSSSSAAAPTPPAELPADKDAVTGSEIYGSGPAQ